MSRRGDNIHKRSDGRREGRYVSCRNELDKAVYKSVYAHSYADCSEKLKLAQCDLLPVSKPMACHTVTFTPCGIPLQRSASRAALM